MSPPVCFREPLCEKRNSRTNGWNPMGTNKMDKFRTNNSIRDSRLSEFQIIMEEKLRVEIENSALKQELAKLRRENEKLIKDSEANILRFETELNEMKSKIKDNESTLIENNRKCIQQQRKYVDEINLLKSESGKLKIELAKRDKQSAVDITKLKSELKSLQLSYKTLKAQNFENSQKSSKYKNKLKFAIKIINQLNNMLIDFTARIETCPVGTQTEPDDLRSKTFEVGDRDSQRLSICRSNRTIEKENLLLSDIFFKTHSFSDNELMIFNEKNCKNQKDGHLCK